MKISYPVITDKPHAELQRSDNGGNGNSKRASYESKDIFHIIAENTSDLIMHFQHKPIHQLVYVSPSCTRVTGYTPEEFSADPALAIKFVHPDDRKLFNDFLRMDNTSAHEPFILRWIHKDGRIIWIEQTQTIIRDELGEPVDIYYIARDITERKQAEIKTRQSEKRYRLLAENVTDVIWTVDIKNPSQLTYISPSVARLLGYTVEEAMARKMAEIFTPASFDTCMRVLAEEMSIERSEQNDLFRSRTLDLEFCRKDGTIVPVEIKCSLIREADSQPVEILVVGRDITESKLAEEALRDSQKFNASLLENAPHATVVINPDTSIRYVNPAWERLNGWTQAEVVGMKAPYPWWPEEYLEVFNEGFKEAMKQDIGKGEVIAQKKNGELYWIDMNWTSVTQNGELQYLLINSTDITERIKAQEKQQAIIKTALDGFWICSLDGKFLEVNDSYCKMIGYTREELLKMSIQDIEAVENPEQTVQRIKTITEEGSDRFETQHKRKDGQIIDIEISVNCPNAGEGQMFVFVRDITQRKRAEKALANEAIRRRILIEQSRDGIVILDQNGKVIEANRRFAEMLGYSVEEVLHLNIWDWEYQYPHERVVEMIRTVDENGDHFETRHRRKDGSVYDVEISTNGATFAGQKLIFCVCRDITQRKQAEEALRESEEKFSKAFHASPVSISISRLADGKFIEVNDGFLRDKGYTREEIIGHHSTEFNIWANQGKRERIVQTLTSGGRVHNELSQFRTKEGYIRTGLMSAEIISIGNEPCMLVMNIDITQQKLAEERLRLLSSVTQQVSDSTIVTDRNFKITYMNQAAQDLLGYSVEEALGKGLDLFNAEPVPEEVIRNISQTVASGKVWSATVPKRRKDGNIITCESRMSPLYDEKGQIFSFIDVQRDVTEQKKMEVKLQEHKQLIESILAAMPEGVLVIDGNDRIILANEAFYKIFHHSKRATVNKLLSEAIHIDQLVNLYKAVKRGKYDDNTLEFRYRVQNLEKIINCVVVKMDGECTLLTFTDISRERDEEEKLYLTDRLASIGEMAAGLAHELNNPLTGIMALSQLLVGGDISGECKEDLESIHSEAKRAASIVKNVLLFARNNTYENGQASVNEVVRDVLRLREHEEKVSNIQVVTNLEDKLPDITIDKYQLQQVFLNIILNAEAAIKETNRPGILMVTTERVNNHVTVMFKDNGCGIKKHIMPRIFDPFFTTKDIGKGTGLGLSICYSIVVKHGGKISVKSQVNEGSTFTIRIPVVT
jgi:PAS domain S-box-containing protein